MGVGGNPGLRLLNERELRRVKRREWWKAHRTDIATALLFVQTGLLAVIALRLQ